MQLTTVEVISADDIKAFHQFPRDLYATDEQYISHIDQDIDAIFNAKVNTAFSSGEAKRWMAFDEERVVGKVAAFYSTDLHQVGIGFFDSIDSQAVANLLFDTAIDWLKGKGYSRVGLRLILEREINIGDYSLRVLKIRPTKKITIIPTIRSFLKRMGLRKS